MTAAAYAVLAAVLLGAAVFAACIASAEPEPDRGAVDPNAVEPEGDGAWL